MKPGTPTVYVCSCGNTYTSPIVLRYTPKCSGDRAKHTPRDMRRVEAGAAA